MEINETMLNVICKIENIIVRATYNESYDDGEGCYFRYPVEYYINQKCEREGNLTKARGLVEIIDPDYLETMRYKFGSNQLNIGIAIKDVLAFLEKRYQLDFNSLELTYKNMRKEAMENGTDVFFEPGKYIVGVDIPEGKYIVARGKEEHRMPNVITTGAQVTLEEGAVAFLANKDIIFNEGNIILRRL